MAQATTNGFDEAKAAVFVKSDTLPDDAPRVQGPDFNVPHELADLLGSYANMGFQGTTFARAVDIINRMRMWKLGDDPTLAGEHPDLPPSTGCSIFLGFTSNLISSGLREIIRFLVQHRYVTTVVTTAGGIEEDLIKSLSSTYLTPEGTFNLDGASLRRRGLNRIGNLLVPNDNYCKFEDWVMPILDRMADEQYKDGAKWTPSRVIERLGREINDESSVLYWAARNGIPVFCPALTDGSFGDMLSFHSVKRDPEPLVIDIVSDIRRINELGRSALKAGIVILGGGVCKHQIANAMLYRNGADFAVYINTGQEFDGSDSGARPDEAISWGKIKSGSENVKVFADATLVFPMLVAATWGKAYWEELKSTDKEHCRLHIA